MRRYCAAFLAFSILTTPMQARSQVVGAALEMATGSVASELAGSLLKSVLGSIAGNLFSRLFSSPTLTAEQAAKMLRERFANLELDHETVNKETLADSVHDYIVTRNDSNITTEDRRKAVRDIIYQTNLLEAMMTRLIKNGQLDRYLGDYMVVTSTRITFLTEQNFLETNAKNRAAGNEIIATQAHTALRFVGNSLIQHYNDTTDVDCVSKNKDLHLFTANGKVMPDIVQDRYGHKSKHNTTTQVCWSWMRRSFGPGSYVADHYPTAGLWLKPNLIYQNPATHNQYAYRYRLNDQGEYAFGIADSHDEARRQQILRSITHYPKMYGDIDKVLYDWIEIANKLGSPEVKKKVMFIQKWLTRTSPFKG